MSGKPYAVKLETKVEATLGEVLSRIEDFKWDMGMYLPSRPWLASTPCLLLEDDLENTEADADPDLPPEYAAARDMQRTLTVSEAKDTVDNARRQLGREPRAEERVEAFAHYVAHDAFLNLHSDEAD